MKNRIIGYALLVLVAAGSLAAFAYRDDKDGKEIKWHNFPDALAKGKAENKMIVVDFYTDWCTWCKVMDEKTYGNEKVMDFAAKKLVMSKVDAESKAKTSYKGKQLSYRELSAGFGVRGYPATIFLTPQGEFITHVSGYIKPDKFIPILEYLEGGHYKDLKFEEFLAKRDKKN